MIVNQYQVEVDEITQATLSFIESRPMIKLILWGMKLACLIMLTGFIFKAWTHTVTPFDLITTLFAISWLFFRKKLNAFLLKKNLNRRQADQFSREYHFSPYKVWWKENNRIPQQLLWQQIPFVFKHAMGYMIPLTGVKHSGKFLWLPKRGFKEEQEFIELLQKKEVKLKNIA